jgi:hypothetical protein
LNIKIDVAGPNKRSNIISQLECVRLLDRHFVKSKVDVVVEKQLAFP